MILYILPNVNFEIVGRIFPEHMCDPGYIRSEVTDGCRSAPGFQLFYLSEIILIISYIALGVSWKNISPWEICSGFLKWSMIKR